MKNLKLKSCSNKFSYLYIDDINESDDSLLKKILAAQDPDTLEMLRLVSDIYDKKYEERHYDYPPRFINEYFEELIELINASNMFNIRICGFFLTKDQVRQLHRSN